MYFVVFKYCTSAHKLSRTLMLQCKSNPIMKPTKHLLVCLSVFMNGPLKLQEYILSLRLCSDLH